MFSLLWRFLPGAIWVRVFLMTVAAVAVVWAVLSFVYPWMGTFFTTEATTVEQ